MRRSRRQRGEQGGEHKSPGSCPELSPQVHCALQDAGPASSSLTPRQRPPRPGRLRWLARAHSLTKARPHPRAWEAAASARGLTCGRGARSSAEERGAGRLRTAPRRRLQPHCRARRKTPPAARALAGGAPRPTSGAAPWQPKTRPPAPRLLPGSDVPRRSLRSQPGSPLCPKSQPISRGDRATFRVQK